MPESLSARNIVKRYGGVVALADGNLDVRAGEVVALIGEPDNTSYFREYDMVYRLGMERGFISIDSEWLVLRLDANQVVTKFRIVRD